MTLPSYTRLTRAAALSELARDYVTATRCAGAGTLHLMFDTVLPNCLAPLIVQATLGFATAILDAAALGFLGLGAQPPTPEWGTMLAGALQFYQRAWWVLAFPGLAILLTVLAFNLFGDGLRDALDPQAEALMRAAGNPQPGRSSSPPRAACSARSTALDLDARRRRASSASSASPVPARRVAMLAVMGLIAWPGRVRADRLRFAGIDLLRLSAAPAPPPDRQGHGDGVPGADVVAQSLLSGRLADRREPARAPRGGPPRGARAGDRSAAPGRHSGTRDTAAARFRTSSPAA